MPFAITWLVEKRVLYSRMYGDVTLDDLQGLGLATRKMIEEGDAPVHIISMTAEIGRVPVNLKTITSVMDFSNKASMGWVLHITGNQVTGFIASILGQVAGVPMRTIKSVNEGLLILGRVDPTLPADQLEKAKSASLNATTP